MSLISVYGESYPVVQINGQRIVGPCESWKRLELLSGKDFHDFKEIFIGRIPHELTEMELLLILAAIGPIWKFRLMMNFSGQNRGFGYIQYIFEEHHKIALATLNGKEILPGHSISACMSRNICTLIMGGLRRELYPFVLLKELEGLVNLKSASVKMEKGNFRYYLSFPTHRDAALGRRTILSAMPNYGKNGWIRWADN